MNHRELGQLDLGKIVRPHTFVVSKEGDSTAFAITDMSRMVYERSEKKASGSFLDNKADTNSAKQRTENPRVGSSIDSPGVGTADASAHLS